MDDLRLLNEMRAEAPEPDAERLHRLRATLAGRIAHEPGHERTAIGAPPRERLLGTLGTQAAVRGTAARRVPRRLRRVGAALAGVAAATLLAVVIQGGAAAPAFAVDERADGTVDVWIKEFRDAADLQAELGRAGVKAVVDYLPAGRTCAMPRGKEAALGGRMRVGVGQDGDGVRFSITKGQVKSGQTLVLAVSRDEDDLAGPPVGMSLTMIEGQVSACEPISMSLPPAGKPGDEPGGAVPKSHDGTGGRIDSRGEPGLRTSGPDDGGPSHDTSGE